jgi:hypothetical protein
LRSAGGAGVRRGKDLRAAWTAIRRDRRSAKALKAGDGAKAMSYARRESGAVRRTEHFLAMVRNGCGALLAARYTESSKVPSSTASSFSRCASSP